MNILVTGANGQLGNCIRKAVKNDADNYFYTDVNELDICSFDSCKAFVKDNDIDVIVNCAAYTNVDKAEEPEEFETVKRINTEAVKNLALLAKEHGITLLHVSTDYVFGGNLNNTPCTEEQTPNPTGVYGMTKLMAEDAIKESGCKVLIFRTAWLYSEYGRNFVKTMLNLLATKDELKVVMDQCGTPTYAQDLADAMIGVINNRQLEGNEGIYNYSNQGVCSWFDFTSMISRIAEIEGCTVRPCRSSEFPSKVKRPAYSVLDKSKYENTFGRRVPYWTDSLKKCIDNLKAEEK